jgi:hypothetical protein
VGDEEVTLDRRRSDRRGPSAQGGTEDAGGKLQKRKKVARRRQIDPTTCERDYTDREVEFMNALDDYKRHSGRMFPTCSEVLEVVRSLGYVKVSPAGLRALTASGEIAADEDTTTAELVNSVEQLATEATAAASGSPVSEAR